MLKRKKNYKKTKDNIFDEEESSIIEGSTQARKHKKSKNKKKYDILNSFLMIIFLIIIICLIIIFIFIFLSYNSNKSNTSFNLISNYNSSNNLTQAQNITILNITINKNITDDLIKFNISSIKINEININISNKSNISNITNIPSIINNNQIDDIIYQKRNSEILPREKALDSGIDYLEKCKNGILINNITFNVSSNPKISVTIPVYNSENTIKAAIRSIQNQNMTDLEIILVDDVCNNQTKTIIEKMKEEDERIKIIYNNKNMGTFYSRCIGSLMAKGKYILTLDNDDMFLDKDVFETVYEEAEDYFDIVAFKVLQGFNYISRKNIKDNYAFNRPNNLIINQPELGIFPITRNNTLYPNDIYIWGKLINTGVYKAAVNILGKERYSTYIIWVEDTSIFFIICNIAQSYKFIEKYGLFHFLSGGTASIRISNEKRFFSEVFLLDIIFDFSKNNYKKYAAYKLMAIKDYNFINLSLNSTKKTYLKSVVKKIMNCEYIEDKLKEDIKLKYANIDIFR